MSNVRCIVCVYATCPCPAVRVAAPTRVPTMACAGEVGPSAAGGAAARVDSPALTAGCVQA